MSAWIKAGYGVARQRETPPAPAAAAAAAPAAVVDCRGLSCPWPSRKVANAIGEVAPGGVLEVLATDPGAPGDLKAFARRTGHRIVEQSQVGAVLRILVQRAQ
jgi:TusA-related sulfurtransferase